MKKYICPGCGNVFYEGNVPDKCPTCRCEAGFFKEKKVSADEILNHPVHTEPVQQESQPNIVDTNACTSNKNVVTILGYMEYFAMGKAVDVYKNGLLIGSVSPKGKLEIRIDGETELTFKCGLSLNSVTCKVSPGDWVVLSLKSQLKAILATQDNYEAIRQNLQEEADSSKHTKFTLLWILIIAAIGFFGFMYISSRQHSNSDSTTFVSAGNFGGLGSSRAVVRAIENYIPDIYIVMELVECKEVASNEVEYNCKVRINASGSPIHNGHGRLIQDASGRNVRGSFTFD